MFLDIGKFAKMATVKSTISRTVDLPPSCMEYLPKSVEYFLIGTYFLQNPDQPEFSEPQERNGSIILMQHDSKQNSINELSTLPVPHGVLDLHFSPNTAGHFCTANSTGTISFYNCLGYEKDETPTLITHLWTHTISDQGHLVLALAWHPTNPTVMAVSLSDGNIVVLQRESGILDHQDTEDFSTCWSQAHSLEAWTISFNPYASQGDAFILYTGGDDSNLKETTCLIENGECSLKPTWTNQKIHGAGVTAILPIDKDTMLTGSYDDNIRVLSLATGRPKVLVELNLDGGVWRLKRLDSKDHTTFYVLASCMYAGCTILRISKSEGQYKIEVLAKFKEHKSMNYASEAFISDQGINVVSTSFYDKLICLWTFDLIAGNENS
jgi:diphthamide biosynthesis protein 7